ncbi:MmpS family transport accessory protein [Amycolatopsis nigrescens]|uniref:MmpS family transport accessory protein n=1 Tax=Amycolatopsis nigrescens TaxID=381445 RepID=UPI000378B896|nr:MmpS family transport accessory protein [Amycolatopsis nigrescens]
MKDFTAPPERPGLLLARKTWWLPWLLGAAVLTTGAVTVAQYLGDSGRAAGGDQLRSPGGRHRVAYEITGGGSSPEIRYVVDGVATTARAESAPLPWREEFDLQVGAGRGVVQVLAANDGTVPLSCAIRVDGVVVQQSTAPGGASSVSCSSVLRSGPN